ncbi:MAG: AI-2E family transporter [Candidatus Delongbacteria bacterium]|jgi:predicted PurR-regulated permease PerM|nr:AI-2E family transporter [Candidatus Delongbacteria bacterium]
MKSFRMNDGFFLVLLLLLSVAFLKLIGIFIIDIFLAVVLYIMFRKPFTYLLKKMKSRKRASSITVLIVFLVVAIPLFFVGTMVSIEATNSYQKLKVDLPEYQEMLSVESVKEYALKVPFVGEKLAEQVKAIDFELVKEMSSKTIMSVSTYIFKLIQAVFFNVTSLLMHLLIIPFLLFYLFYDGKKLVSKIHAVSPFDRKDEQKGMNELVKITDTIVIYTFLIGVLEGIYGGVLFSLLGIGSPFFWGILMVGLSMIPVVGANTIIVPAALIQFAMGNYGNGSILLFLGAGLVIVNQNIIKPKLTGDRTGLHPVIMFISSLGGIAWLGIVGFLVGPLIAALFIVAWSQYAIKFKSETITY